MNGKEWIKQLFSDMKSNLWIDLSFIAGAGLVGLMIKWVVENNTLLDMF